jgi:hypothetical protein
MPIDDFPSSRREVIAAGIGFAAAAAPLGAVHAAVPARPAAAAGFDFLIGSWQVRHRKLRERLAGSKQWFEFPGSLVVRPILGGLGNIDENVLDDPAGRYRASSIRRFDPAAGNWSIYWADERYLGIGDPVVGRFDGDIGRFYGDETLGGRPIRIRFTYEDLEPGRARWSQAFSPDAGQSWETNWIMDFTQQEAVR